MRVLLHTGKGGVGKTTLAAATALHAAAQGRRVFLLSADPAHSLGDALGVPVGAQAVQVAPGVVAQEVAALDELDRSWREIERYLRALLRDDALAPAVEELLVFPGLEELFALRTLRAVEASGRFDLCVVDCAPTGGTLRLLRLPDALRLFTGRFFELERSTARLLRPLVQRFDAGRLLPHDAFFDALERLCAEVEQVRDILLDADRTSARLVVNTGRVVVDEARRAHAYLALHGVASDAVLVNRLLPPAVAGGYFARWAERERELLTEIEESFGLALLRAPLAASEPVGAAALAALGAAMFGDRDPAAPLTREQPIAIERRGDHTVLSIAIGGLGVEDLEVSAAGAELFVRVRDARRRLSLPASLAGRPIERSRLAGGRLEVVFSP